MVQTANGYAPMKGLANRLKQSHEFYDKDFSNSINKPIIRMASHPRDSLEAAYSVKGTRVR